MSEHAHAQEANALPAPRVEPSDVTRRIVVIMGGGLLVIVAGLLALAAALYPGSVTTAPTLPEQAPIASGAPALQSSPRADMARYREQELALLNGAGWVDRDHGVVRIPIDRAMRQLAQEGIAGWPRQ